MIKENVKPGITSYQSLLLIFSMLVEKGTNVLRQDTLVPMLYDFYLNERTKILFEDIYFNKHSDTITSEDIENNLIKLQTYGALGRLNPAYEKIVIYISREEANNFIGTFDEKFVLAAQEVSKAFKEGEVR